MIFVAAVLIFDICCCCGCGWLIVIFAVFVVAVVGVVAIRFTKDGHVAAFAAGGLKNLKTNGLEIVLPERMDVALVTESDGKVHGVLQGLVGNVPAVLLAITPNWQRLTIPSLGEQR